MKLIERLANARLDAFADEWGYDVSYLRALLARGVAALRPMQAIERIGNYRKGIPLVPWTAAKIVAAQAEDCGPCVQLGVKMAERAGVPADVLRAVITRDDAALPDDVRLAVQFAAAAIAHAPEADALRERIVAAWGEDAVVSLAYAIVATRSYPMMKYVLGYGRACTRVVVGGEAVVPHAAGARNVSSAHAVAVT